MNEKIVEVEKPVNMNIYEEVNVDCRVQVFGLSRAPLPGFV